MGLFVVSTGMFTPEIRRQRAKLQNSKDETVDKTNRLSAMRQDYREGILRKAEAPADPLELFALWMDDAIAADLPEPNAMTLATIGSDGRPAARIVLLKGVGPDGFRFFTNYDSRKGEELAAHPFAALVFLWLGLQRQVRVEGRVHRISGEESDAYFVSRPRGSRLGAWASPQSQSVSNREELEARLEAAEARFGEGDVPRPPNWGGYRLAADRIEFWQGRTSRLHDRLVYLFNEGKWERERLAP